MGSKFEGRRAGWLRSRTILVDWLVDSLVGIVVISNAAQDH